MLLLIICLLQSCSKDSPKRLTSGPGTGETIRPIAVNLESTLVFGSNDPGDWVIFRPRNGGHGEIRVSQVRIPAPSGNFILKMESQGAARYAITSTSPPLQVTPGQRYRLSAWARSDQLAGEVKGTRGVLLRATLFDSKMKDYPGGHFYVGSQGVILGDPIKFEPKGTGASWERLDGVVEIPDGVSVIKFHVFCWWANGVLYLDSPKMERVAADTPVARLL